MARERVKAVCKLAFIPPTKHVGQPWLSSRFRISNAPRRMPAIDARFLADGHSRSQSPPNRLCGQRIDPASPGSLGHEAVRLDLRADSLVPKAFLSGTGSKKNLAKGRP